MRWLIAFLFLQTVPAFAVECVKIKHEGHPFTACKVDAATQQMRLFLNHPTTGMPLGSFGNVETLLGGESTRLVLAMNAGMYHQDRSPVGHYIENGKELAPVITADGPGNFGLLPNGVFCIGTNSARVYETSAYQNAKPTCNYASQSGPMLVIDGKLHPRFLPDSDSRYIRNGVGTSSDGLTIWFAISETPVTFHEFGTLFRDELKTPQALYFDGNISRLYAPGIGRHDGGLPMGPIVGVTTAKD